MSKQFQLTVIAVLAITGFFMLPVNIDWSHDVLMHEASLVPAQLDNMDIESRMIMRYKAPYHFELAVKQFFEQNPQPKPPLLLLPPTGYLTSKGVDLKIHEPAVFYYFTGIRSVWTNSSNVADANWVVVPVDSQMMILPIENRNQLDSMLTIFKPYPPSL